jgi:four helix bundle protein
MFEKLEVYQKAVDFADEIASFTEGFPRGYGFLVDQLNRAALSISANIAQGNGRFTRADRRTFFGIARGAVQECVPLLELPQRRGLLTPDQHASFKESLEEFVRMLSGLINSLDKQDGRFARKFLAIFAAINRADFHVESPDLGPLTSGKYSYNNRKCVAWVE